MVEGVEISAEPPIGRVIATDYIDEVTKHLSSSVSRMAARRVIAKLLTQYPQDKDFCLISNEIGSKLEQMSIFPGHLEMAAQCYEWAYVKADPDENLHDPTVIEYGGNLIRVLQKIAKLPQITETASNFLREKNPIIRSIAQIFGYLGDYHMFNAAISL